MADARHWSNDGNKMMHSLQPFLDSTLETGQSLYGDTLQHTDAQFSWQDSEKTSSYTTRLPNWQLSRSEQNLDADDMDSCRPRLERQSSIVDGLLSEIYDRWQDHKHDSFDSDTFTECSSTSEVMHWRSKTYFHDIDFGGRTMGRLHPALLQEYSAVELKNLVGIMTRYVNQMSARLVRQLKRRERRMSKLQNNCDIVTAIIQASSPKRRIDTRMRFTVEPSAQGESAFDQWKDAMKAVARLPLGIPDEFRRKVWLSLADQHIHELKIDWEKTVKIAFNERSNPDDNKLGLQIVKDLHRTGCSGFSGEDNEEERALLKRILLAYARWNKTVGYCQGFNVIAALLLEVMDRKEADAFKVMIYLIDHVLPTSYFANNLRALSVDMAVFRDLLKIFPKLSKHLDYLQHAQDQMSGGCYEPPLTNVFTMQWFLTLFATCLPKATTLRVWDAILLDGSEILLRTALVIWGKLSSRILTVSSADEFYTLMGDITQEMLEGRVLDADSMIKSIYSIAPFPFPQLTELREKYTYNIRPFTPANKRTWADGAVLPSDEDDLEDEDIEAITCFTGFIPVNAAAGGKAKALEGDQRTGSIPDISSLGPGAYGLGSLDGSVGGTGLGGPGGAGGVGGPAYMERMTTDISALKKQYVKLRQRQRQAHIIQTTASAASAKQQPPQKPTPLIPAIETPRAMNHLFVNKQGGTKQGGASRGRNRLVAAGPRIADLYPVTGISGNTQTTVQPQAMGNTKCKWIQKSSKQEPKNGQLKKSDSVSSSKGSDIEKNENNNNNAVTQSMYEIQAVKKSQSMVELETVKTSCEERCDETVRSADDSGIVLTSEATSEATNDTSDSCSILTSEGTNDTNDSGIVLTSEATNTDTSITGESETTSPAKQTTVDDRPVNSEPNLKLSPDDKGDKTRSKSENDLDLLHFDEELTEIVENSQEQTKHETQKEGEQYQLESDTETVQCKSETYDDDNRDCLENVKGADEVKHDIDGANEVDSDKVGDFSDATSKGTVTVSDDPVASGAACSGQAKLDSKCSPVGSLGTSEPTREHFEQTDEHANQTHTTAVPIAQSSTARPIAQSSTAGPIAQSSPTEKGHASVNIKQDMTSASRTEHTLRQEKKSATGASRNHGNGKTNLTNTTDRARSKSFEQYYNTKRNLMTSSSQSTESTQKKFAAPKKAFNPFPVLHVNQNRAKTGIRLGLYKQSTLEEFEKNLKSQPVWGK